MPSFTKPFLFVGFFSLTAAAAFAQQYTITDLGSSTEAYVINGKGEVGGMCGAQQACFWSADGRMRPIEKLAGCFKALATGINDMGQVVGYCERAETAPAFIWTAESGLAELPTPDGTPNWVIRPAAINNHGAIAGWLRPSGNFDGRGFVYQDGTYTLFDSATTAWDLDDDNQAVGGNLSEAILWDGTGAHVLPSFDSSSGAFGIDRGIIAGFVGSHAAAWTAYGVADLGTMCPTAEERGFALARAVANGVIVGSTSCASFPSLAQNQAFVFDLNGPGYGFNLNALAATDGSLEAAYGVNTVGQIVGNWTRSDGRHGFILTPRDGSTPPPPPPSGNLLIDGGFEESTPPQLGPHGWISDDFRQVAAKSETNQARSGEKNGACWATDNLDCGLFQDIIAPKTGTYTLTIYANSDRPGALVGANANDETAASADVAVRGFLNYGDAYVLTFHADEGQTIRVWGYSPAVPGYLVMDDATLTGPTS
jgi:uncharacterized membrane protein